MGSPSALSTYILKLRTYSLPFEEDALRRAGVHLSGLRDLYAVVFQIIQQRNLPELGRFKRTLHD